MMNKQDQFDDGQQHSSQAAYSQPVNTPEDKELSPPASPEGWHTHQEKGFNSSVHLSAAVEQRSHLMVRFLGYGLLAFALFDYTYIVIPPRFTDPLWELQTIGALVEHAAVPMLGLVFVFYRHRGYIRKWERNLLGFLSWVSLLAGLLYLLIFPLGVADTWRIYHYNNAQIAAQLSHQHQQVKQIKGKLNQSTDEQLKQLVASLTPQGSSLEIKNSQALKEQFLTKFSQAERSIQIQANRLQENQTQELIEKSVRWNLGALVSGTLFIWIWHLTYWTRKGFKLKK